MTYAVAVGQTRVVAGSGGDNEWVVAVEVKAELSQVLDAAK